MNTRIPESRWKPTTIGVALAGLVAITSGVHATNDSADRESGSPASAYRTLWAERFVTWEHDLELLEFLPTWDGFYRSSGSTQIGMERLQDMIVRRVSRELEFSSEKRTTLATLLKQEQDEVTRRTLLRWGSRMKVVAAAFQVDESSDLFWAELRALRKQVRLEHEPKFQAAFNAAEKKLIDNHLRNHVIRVSEHRSGDGIRINGVGR